MYIQFEEAPIARYFFANTRIAVLWLIVRLYVGWQWFEAGWGKLHSPAWIGSESGQALNGFVSNALSKTSGPHPDVQGWYGHFLENIVLANPSLWAHVVTFAEITIGIALIVGIFTGIAAFFGLFMNFNFLLAGAVSVNPILAFLGVFLVLAWKIAGYIGLDRFVLPLLGTPWKPGTIFTHKENKT
ncbi:MAG: DoxX family membrane protein [Candidatus Pacebacteria bacterium]|nr:DoxX family membrane protein [Candidatus Paceibacterota bacterium]